MEESDSEWKISETELFKGSILALKNTDRLIHDASVSFDGRRYSITLTLAVLALEEFGKHLMLFEAIKKKRMINEKIWKNEFSHHETKLKAIPRILGDFSSHKNDEEVLRTNEKLKALLVSLKNEKLDAIYLDWDNEKHVWNNYDDLPDEMRKEKASKTLELAKRFLKIYIEKRGDIPFTTIEEKMQLLQDKKIHAFCEECVIPLITMDEVLAHNVIGPKHILTWYTNS